MGKELLKAEKAENCLLRKKPLTKQSEWFVTSLTAGSSVRL
jgi:hypothetical protein